MLFDLKQAPGAEKIILQSVKLRRPLPDSFQNAPRLFPWLGLFLVAFNDLINDRNSDSAHIPWTARQKWAEVHELDRVATDLLHVHLVAMDHAYLKWWHEQQRANNPEGRTPRQPPPRG